MRRRRPRRRGLSRRVGSVPEGCVQSPFGPTGNQGRALCPGTATDNARLVDRINVCDTPGFLGYGRGAEGCGLAPSPPLEFRCRLVQGRVGIPSTAWRLPQPTERRKRTISAAVPSQAGMRQGVYFASIWTLSGPDSDSGSDSGFPISRPDAIELTPRS